MIQGNSLETQDALFGGSNSLSSSASQFINNSFMNYSNTVIPDNDFYQSAVANWDRVNSASYQARIDSLRSNFNSSWKSNDFRALNSLEEIREAPSVMQKYIMSHPTIRKSFNRGTIDGYAGYRDWNPGTIKHTDPVYRNAVSDITVRAKGEEPKYSTSTYYDVTKLESDELTFQDKVAIHQTWHHLDKFAIGDENPTGEGNLK